jgi:carboxysome peptide B
MDIFRVESPLVCTRRVDGLKHASLRVLRDAAGRRQVATDPLGARPGNQVFTVAGSAARYAQGDVSVLTDLTIGGIIDDRDDASEVSDSKPVGAPAAICKPEFETVTTSEQYSWRHNDGK